MDKKTSKLETIIVINIVLLIFHYFFKEKWLIIASIAISALSLTSSYFLNVIHKLWSKFFEFLGLVNSKILLSIVFILVLVPTAFLKKLFVRKPLSNKD